MRISILLALLAAEGKRLQKRLGGVVVLLLWSLLTGFGTPFLIKHVYYPLQNDPPAAPVSKAIPPTAIDGEPPSWFHWPEPWVDESKADVRLQFSYFADDIPTIDILPLHSAANWKGVRSQVREQIAEERARRLDRLGITERPFSVANTEVLPPGTLTQASWGVEQLSTSAVSALLASVLGFSLIFADLIPGLRARGWLETLFCLPISRLELLVGWWTFALLTQAAVLASQQVGLFAAGWILDLPPDMRWKDILVLSPPMCALGIRLSLRVTSTAAGNLRMLLILPLLMAATGLALASDHWIPGSGAWFPIGGLVLNSLGLAQGVGVIGGSLITTVFLLADCARLLRNMQVHSTPSTEVAARRDRGNYLPEALLLLGIAAAGTFAWGNALPNHLGLRLFLQLGLFLGLPAVAVGFILRMPVRTLLRWNTPSHPTAWLSPVLLGITVPAATYLGAAMMAWFPNRVLQQAWNGVPDTLVREGWPTLLTLGLAPALFEELLCRGATLSLLQRRFSASTANILQAFGFALLHGTGVRMPFTFLFGLICGFLVLRYRSLWPAMWLHACHNLLLLAFSESLVANLDSRWPYWATVAATTALAAWLLHRFSPPATTGVPQTF